MVKSFALVWCKNAVSPLDFAVRRNDRYDCLKGIGIVMMVAFHAFVPVCVNCRALTYLGAHTMPIILLHFAAFKVVSAIGVLALGMPLSRIADFSVTFTTGYWWVAYTAVGVLLPLGASAFVMRFDFVQRLVNLQFHSPLKTR